MKTYTPTDFRDQEATRNTATIQQSRYTQPPSISSLSDFQVVVNTGGTTGGATASFKLVNTIQGIAAIRLLRGDTDGFNTATVLTSWMISSVDLTKTFTFVDTSPILALKDNYYWLQIIPTATVAPSPVISNSTPLYTLGPQVLPQVGAAQLPPAQIQGFSVSLGAGSGGFQPVYVNWLAPSDPNFSYMLIEVAGYNGQPNQVFLTQSESSPFTFNMIQTGETLTLKAFAVSLTGLVNTTSPPTASITLNGSATVPAIILAGEAIQIVGGIQVSFNASLEPVTLYTIYKSLPGAGSGSASSIGTVTPSSGTAVYNYLDTTAVNQAFDYYIKVTDSIGTSGFSNVITTDAADDYRGNVIFSVTNGFSYTSDTASITWSWTGLIIYRSTGQTTTIPDGTQAITGLSSSTTYTFFPYWDEVAQAIAWVTDGSGVGTPAYAYTAPTLAQLQLQELLSHVALAFDGMTGATTASGGGGGTGGGGGGGGGGGHHFV